MTSLATQLQAVASAAPREERLKGKASLLYELREAADIDLATIYAVGVQGRGLFSHAEARGDGRRRRPSHPGIHRRIFSHRKATRTALGQSFGCAMRARVVSRP